VDECLVGEWIKVKDEGTEWQRIWMVKDQKMFFALVLRQDERKHQLIYLSYMVDYQKEKERGRQKA